MKAEQLIFDLARRPALAREDFLVAPCNEDAMSLIDAWPEWSNPVALIHGPKGAGKTHIARVWQSKSDARSIQCDGDLSKEIDALQANVPQALLIDNAQKFFHGGKDAQDFLFHVINTVKSKPACSLLMTSDTGPSGWSIDLKDLDSRLKAAQIVEILPADETLLMGIFVKQLHDRQLQVDPDVVSYVINRLERSFDQVLKAVEKIDAASLKEKRRITLPFVKKTLSL